MKAVVTGGAGFLGSHLSARLLGAGWEVLCLDNLLTGNRANVQGLLRQSPYEFRPHDVTEYIEVDGEVDAVFHLASPASPVDYLKMPIQTLEAGSLGTRNALGLARARGARFILASTSEVYGDPLVNPQTEDYWGNVNVLGPRAVYDEAKRFAEALTVAYRRHHGMDTRIVRIFNTFGPRMRPNDGRVVSNFIVQALKGKPLTVYGSGRQTRSFCYVDDLIDGIVRLAAAPRTDSIGRPFNLGNPRERTVEELAERILKLTGSSNPIEHRELPEDDPKVRCPDISRARSELGWEPKVDIDDGLRLTIDYFRQTLA